MYEAYWGLKEKPFENTPDPRFLYRSPKHEEALTRLIYAIQERKGGAVMTGEFGSGKTVLSRALLDELDPVKYKLLYITNTQITAIEFLREIVRQLQNETPPLRKSDLLHILNEILKRNVDIGKDTVIIIDEAQLIADQRIFEELRMLLNFQWEKRFLLTLLLLGQPELREKINRIPQFKQRLPIRYHLTTLNAEETGKYIAHRLRVAGREEEIFDVEALDLIHRQSKGCPREINNICDMALFIGFGKEVPRIGEDIVREVTSDLGGRW
ncbi:AAA family ATPase [bacterium]|nr:AAA family ATPase [bacterium]